MSGVPPNIPPRISISTSSPESSPPPEEKKTSGKLGGRTLEQVRLDSKTSNELKETTIGDDHVVRKFETFDRVQIQNDYVPTPVVIKSDSYEARVREEIARLDNDEVQRNRNTQFDNDLSNFSKPGGVSGETISRMMNYVSDRSLARAREILQPTLYSSSEESVKKNFKEQQRLKEEDRTPPWPDLPHELTEMIAQRMARSRTQPAMLEDVLTSIDRAKKGQGGTDKELGEKLYKFVQWARNNTHDLPQDLLQAIEDFRSTRAMREPDLDRRMDFLGVPQQAREPLREALRLYARWRDPPVQPPPRQSSYRDEQEMLSAVSADEQFPERMREWEKGGFSKIPGLLREQLTIIGNVPNNGIPDIMLRDLRELSYPQ